ncbi:MAG: type II toxin-antitoxin system RelE/ParE family toxin [Alphaproteobacteria bacterium]|nr:type II toxin-antitoxin system RelE/ParE family toxin [Alphaproteobacteria bacterium]
MPAARLELIAAQDWYEGSAPGLGARFRAEVDFQAQRIATNSLLFPEILAGVRRARLRRFPYGLFFRAMPDAIYVIACFHSSRDPLIWRSRV